METIRVGKRGSDKKKEIRIQSRKTHQPGLRSNLILLRSRGEKESQKLGAKERGNESQDLRRRKD